MVVGDAWLEKADALLVQLFAGWNNLTTVLVTVIILYVAYPWLTWRDPDTHPLLLARQATSSPVRKKGESAVYRSLECPYGYPLRNGLNVKDPDAPKWSPGRNGDIRDIWRRAIQGPLNDDGTPSGQKGKILTVLGREQVLTHEFEGISQEINIVGQQIKSANGSVVAIYLSNSTELIASIFAAAFYGFKAVLIPYKLTTEELIKHLSLVKADVLIAEAGTVELGLVTKSCPELSNVIWVAKYGSRHMDWNEVPEGVGSKLDVCVWHELFDEKKGIVSSELPPFEKDSTVQPLVLFSEGTGNLKLIEYTSENIVAATAAQLSAIPRAQRYSLKDTVLPADSLTSVYPLTTTFAALYSGSTIALNSVAGDAVDIRSAATGVSPTIIITPSDSLSQYHSRTTSKSKTIFEKLNHTLQSQCLDSGTMPKPTTISKAITGGTAAIEPSFSNLRLIISSYEAGSSNPPISSQSLANLRIITGARIIYALTAPHVAGAVTQTNIFDYRRSKGPAHLGTPLSSVELKLIGDEKDMCDGNPVGKVLVSGPAVVGGETVIQNQAMFNDDGTLSFI
ncbi:hypothetical protein UCRPC4_g04982 [Phaeomoniella chlamydospora]|uniref:AMP-dependent synthetase/ligase domain-containing protein n=1 Tax=Phaeomoniella chlamydospora TaxID=158046 RepID=A0A0G2GNH6_PHACM|nr:hypothetical protein UCRPC4_g04982 [Phaeomoniella chlamydospora]